MKRSLHHNDVIMDAMVSQITSLKIVHSTVYSGTDQRKHQSSASLAFVWGIHRGPVNSPHKWPVTRKIFPFDDVIMQNREIWCYNDHIALEFGRHLGSAASLQWWNVLTHWGRVTHICVGDLTIIGSDDGLSPVRRQAIIWTNAGILLIEPLGTNFNEILVEIHTFSFKKMHLKMSSGKWRSFCLGLNVLTRISRLRNFTRSCDKTSLFTGS